MGEPRSQREQTTKSDEPSSRRPGETSPTLAEDIKRDQPVVEEGSLKNHGDKLEAELP